MWRKDNQPRPPPPDLPPLPGRHLVFPGRQVPWRSRVRFQISQEGRLRHAQHRQGAKGPVEGPPEEEGEAWNLSATPTTM